MPDISLKRWHIAQAKRHLTDASFRRSNSRTWFYFMELASHERQLAFNYIGESDD